MPKLPKDCNSRIIGSAARQLVHAAFDVTHWEFHEITGTDHGTDCTIELIENGEWHNHKIEGQIKGTRSPNTLSTGELSFPLDIKTINYGLGSSNAFVLFYVDVDNEIVYYLPLQDYFIMHPNLFDDIERKTGTKNVRIPADNIVSADTGELRELAKAVYVDGPSKQLHRYLSAEEGSR